MNNENIIIYVSSRNNYDMLEGEVFKNIDREGFELINVDDKSSEEEVQKGKQMCETAGVVFLENKSRGVQMATDTVVDFISDNRPNCKWIICFQHDIYPVSKNFFSRLSALIETGQLDEFGGVGFNILDKGDYAGNAWELFQNGEMPIGGIGFGHLGISDNSGRWLATGKNLTVRNKPELFKNPFICEFAMWPVVGLNVNVWKDKVIASEDYQFHIWYPDVAMQLNYNNFPIVQLPRLYCYNNQWLKEKYGMNYNSAVGAQQGDSYHFGSYGDHFTAWKERWGWDYENVYGTFESIKHNYEGTLIYDYYHHDYDKGPLKTYDFGEY